LGEREQVSVVEQALFGVRKPLAANVRLGHAVAADRRAHRAIDDRNAILEDALDRM